MTESQKRLIGVLDDVAEHVAYEADPDDYPEFSTIGFASIKGIDGRCSFASLVRRLADSRYDQVYEDQNGAYRIEVAGLELSLMDGHRGYRLSITNTGRYVPGKKNQLLCVQKDLHRYVLQRLQMHDFLTDGAYVHGRMD